MTSQRLRYSVGRQIRASRKRAGLTTEQLAVHAGIAGSEESRIERGQVGCRLDTLEKLLDVLKLEVDIRPSDSPSAA